MPISWIRSISIASYALSKGRHVSGSSILKGRPARPSKAARSHAPEFQDKSLFAELFPDEEPKFSVNQSEGQPSDPEVPPLLLPTVQELLDGSRNRASPAIEEATRSDVAATEELKRDNVTVLILQVASKSLVESDFRRIAPKGAHIGEWTGPGDILKVFPARDSVTFEQSKHYFIVFKNAAHAQAYRSHVLRLYRLAKKYTPTSVFSPMLLPEPGKADTNNEEYTSVQDFALCPVSQRFELQYLQSPLSAGMKRLLDQGGYLGNEAGNEKAGRTVLFWVEGPTPTTREIKDRINEDGQTRAMAWDVTVSRLNTNAPGSIDSGSQESREDAEDLVQSAPRRTAQRWILTFKDEDEARRFVRAWHRRNLPSTHLQDTRVIYTELLW